MLAPISFSRILLLLTFCLPVALQIQADIFSSDSYVGLRVSIADLLVPLGGLGILVSLLLHQSLWPCLGIPRSYFWLAGLTLAMCISLVTGIHTMGSVSQWALVNKFCGWLVLLSFLLWGSWAATNFSSASMHALFRIFTVFCLLLSVSGMGVLFLRDAGALDKDGLFAYPLAGLMGNRNSFAFLLCAVTVFTGVFHLKGRPLIPSWAFALTLCLLPVAHALIGSRAGWVIQPIVLTVLLILGGRAHLKSMILPLLTGLVLLASLSAASLVNISRGSQGYLISQMKEVVIDETLDYTNPETRIKYHMQSDAYRIQAARDAFDIWKASPLTGGGLGSFLDYQTKKYGQYMDVVDNSLLWLLCETGLVGLFAFLGFYGISIYYLKGRSDPASLAVIGMLLTFGLFSLFHEMLYTRFIWFFLGIGLGLKGVCADQRCDGSGIEAGRAVETDTGTVKEVS